MKTSHTGLIAFAIWSVMAAGFGVGLAGRSTPAQGDYPKQMAYGRADALNGGLPHELAVDNHGVLEANGVSTFNAAQGSANAAIGCVQGQAFPSWVAEIGEQVHITATTAVSVKTGGAVLCS